MGRENIKTKTLPIHRFAKEGSSNLLLKYRGAQSAEQSQHPPTHILPIRSSTSEKLLFFLKTKFLLQFSLARRSSSVTSHVTRHWGWVMEVTWQGEAGFALLNIYICKQINVFDVLTGKFHPPHYDCSNSPMAKGTRLKRYSFTNICSSVVCSCIQMSAACFKMDYQDGIHHLN